jgi:hypothetical protein
VYRTSTPHTFRALGEDYSPMWVDMLAQRGALPTSAITRDAVLSLWRNAPGYYYAPAGTQFVPDTGAPGTYGVKADISLPVNTGYPEYMPVKAYVTLPTEAIARDVLNSVQADALVDKVSPEALNRLVAKANLDPVIDRVLASAAASNLAATGTKAALGTIAVTAGVTLLGAYLLLRYMH